MKMNTKTVVGMGLLTAIVIVLQALALNIRFGIFYQIEFPYLLK